MNRKSHIFMLLMAALLWGTTFVAQSIGADYVGPFTYITSRSFIAVIFLTPLIRVMDRISDYRGIDNRRPRTEAERRLLFRAGITVGVFLCAASAAQQIGIAYTTASKTGFITSLYVVFVPILSIFLKKMPGIRVWISVLIALFGMYLLSMSPGSFTLQKGDFWVFICAILFAFEIHFVAHYSPMLDGVRLSRAQFLVVGIISLVLMLLTEQPAAEALMQALPAILYAGIFSSGIAYTLQIVGQRGVNPTIASMVMSLESVFSAISGWLVLHERMSIREWTGSALIFAAIIIAQIEKNPEKEEQN